MAQTPVESNANATGSPNAYPEVDAFLETISDRKGALIPTLHMAQETYGYLPKEVQLYVAQKLQIPAAKVFGVATFYSLFSMEKRGKYRINVCTGTACFVRGADKVLNDFAKELGIQPKETSEDGLFTLDGVRCVGACGLAPVIMVNEKFYGRLTSYEDVKEITDKYKALGAGGDDNAEN